MKKIFLILLLVFALCLFSIPSFAADYYVDCSCGSNGDGAGSTCGSGAGYAWNNTTSVNNANFSAGDTISFNRDTTCTQNGGLYIVDEAGTSGNVITFGAYGSGALPIIRSTGQWGFPLIVEGDSSYLTFENIDFDGDAIAEDVVLINALSGETIHDIIIQDSTIEGARAGGSSGICYHVNNGYPSGGGNVDDVTLKDSTVQDCGKEGVYIKNYGSTINASNGVNNTLIENVTVTNTGNECLQNTHHDGTRASPSNTTFRGVDCSNNGADLAIGDINISGGGIVIEDSQFHDNKAGVYVAGLFIGGTGGTNDGIVIRNSIFYDLSGVGTPWTSGAENAAIRVYNVKSGTVEIYHNTFYDISSNGMMVSNFSGTTITAKNNIISTTGQKAVSDSDSGPITCTYDLFYANTGGNDCDDGNNQTGDPSFTSTTDGSEDFHLTAASYALDNGTDVGVSDDIEGTARDSNPDIGAYEYVGSNPIAVSATVVEPNASEDGGTTTLRITCNYQSCSSTTVNFNFTSGTATLDVDFNCDYESSVTITGSSADVVCTPVDDSITEGDETIILTIISGTGYDIGSPSSATATIIDNDGISVSRTPGSLSLSPGGGGSFSIGVGN